MLDGTLKAEPNHAHLALARMEEKGLLNCTITQNIDGLHHKAGSKKVVEFGVSWQQSLPGLYEVRQQI